MVDNISIIKMRSNIATFYKRSQVRFDQHILKLFLLCFEKFNLASKYTPRCFVKSCLAFGIPPNESPGLSGFLFLQEKTTSIACLVMSGLKTISH